MTFLKTVIKIGGSLLNDSAILKKLSSSLNEFAKLRSVILVPGGGAFADQVRKYHKLYDFSDSVAHKMALITEDIVGILIGEYLKDGILLDNIDEISHILKQSKIPIFLPSKYILELDELPHSWDVTSDSIAVYLAHKLHSHTVILVKDVDGLFSADPKRDPKAELIQSIKARELNTLKESCVDKALPEFIAKYKISCYLVNGKYPDRIKKIMDEKDTIFSLITP